MKKTIFTAAFAFALFAGALHAQDAVSGKWNASADGGPNGPMEIVFNLKSGPAGALSGNMSMPAMAAMGMGEMPISDGKINGKDVSFKIKITPPAGGPGPGGDMVISYTGKLDGDSLTLNTTMEGMPGGGPGGAQPPMVAKRAAAAAAAPPKK